MRHVGLNKRKSREADNPVAGLSGIQGLVPRHKRRKRYIVRRIAYFTTSLPSSNLGTTRTFCYSLSPIMLAQNIFDARLKIFPHQMFKTKTGKEISTGSIGAPSPLFPYQGILAFANKYMYALSNESTRATAIEFRHASGGQKY